MRKPAILNHSLSAGGIGPAAAVLRQVRILGLEGHGDHFGMPCRVRFFSSEMVPLKPYCSHHELSPSVPARPRASRAAASAAMSPTSCVKYGLHLGMP